ncbi:MAG: aspartate 1-decarboxylase [Thermaerobacter sp.]|nr:aspartate 1-decarboxylase [Thermaerobacter sp.]
MQRTMCKGKIHRATVTRADLEYEGSISLDAALMAAADILPGELVQITSLANGKRWRTYAMPAAAGMVGLNGPAARWFHPGDRVVVLSWGQYAPEELDRRRMRVVFVDQANRVERVEER